MLRRPLKTLREILGNEAGLSIAEAVIAVGLATGISYVMTSNLIQMNKSSKTVDIKNQVQNFSTLAKMTLTDAAGCKKALGIKQPGNALPAVVAANLPPTSQPIAIPSVTIAGKKYVVGDRAQGLQDLYLAELNLVLKEAPSSASSTYYLGELQYRWEKLNPERSIGSASQLITQPAQVSITGGATPGSLELSSCVEASVGKPDETCEQMGGRWLFGKFITQERCNQSAEISLPVGEYFDANEWTAPGQSLSTYTKGIPDQGGANARGERVEVCKYQAPGDATVTSYRCPGNSGSKVGKRCWYNTNARRWQVNDFVAGTWGGTPTGEPLYICTHGVVITQGSTSKDVLDWDQDLSTIYTSNPGDPLAAKFQSATPTTGTEAGLLQSPARCKYVPDQDVWFNCPNADDPSLALQGKAEACIFVRNAKISTNATYSGYFDQFFLGYPRLCSGANCLSQSKTSYTGWARVISTARTINPAADPFSITEATVLPCFQVEINKFAPNDGLTTYPDAKTPLKANWVKTPSQIKQCVVDAMPAAGTPALPSGAMRKQYLPCANVDHYGMYDPANPAHHETFTALYRLGIGGAPAMPEGSCWYFENVKLTGYHATSSAYNATNSTYTGWVRLESPLPKDRYRPRGGPIFRNAYGTMSQWRMKQGNQNATTAARNYSPPGSITWDGSPKYFWYTVTPYVPTRSWSGAPITDFTPGTNFRNYHAVSQMAVPLAGNGRGFGHYGYITHPSQPANLWSSAATDYSSEYFSGQTTATPAHAATCKAKREWTSSTGDESSTCTVDYMPAIPDSEEALVPAGSTPAAPTLDATPCTGGIRAVAP